MEEHFKSLHESLRNDKRNLTIRTISHITNYFLEELDEDELDSYMIIIFNPTYGLLAFINNAAKKKGFESAVSKALELLYTLVDNFPKFIRSYLKQIVQTCLFVCRVNIGSLTKQKTLQIVQMIITSKEYNLNDALVQEIYTVIYDALRIKQSDTYTSEIVVVIGYIIKHFKQVISEEDKCDLLKYIITILAIAAKDKKPTLSDGLFTCICELLYCTVPHEDDREKLYRFIKEFANLVHDNKAKKNASRAALQLFTEHIGLFSELIRRDASYWNTVLRAWLNIGSDNFKAGSKALDKFYLELGKDLRSREVFNELIACFKGDFNDLHIATNKLRLSIRGLGYFAGNFKMFSTPGEIYKTFVFLMQNMEHLYILNANPKSDCIDNLPDYIQTLSYYTKQIDDLNAVHLSFLQKITVTMLRLFPKLSMFHHNLVVEALVINMFCIHKSKSSLSGFLHAIIYQGVMWTCSHNLAREIEILHDNQHCVTYKTYLPLWLGLLKMPKVIKKLEIEEASCQIMLDAFVNELIKTLLVLVNKLNVNVKRQEEHDTIDPLNLSAEKIDDFVIFVNLVDFYVELLGEINPALFHKWIISYSTHLIGKSIKYPLVSGFYKLLSADLKLCDALDYFNEQRLEREEVNSLFESFKIYMQSVIPRIQSTGDDLQLACMQVVLSAPIALIKAVHADYSLVFISVFTFGQNYLSLAEDGVKTIEKWLALLPGDFMNPLLKKVLPHLDYYLRTRAFSTKAEATGAATKKGFRKRQVNVETKPELLRLQHNILKLFARVNSEVCWDFINANVVLEPVVWSKNPLLKVHLKDDNFSLYLDKFMPRILELSLYCSNRKTRGTACQLLHSSIMIMLEKCVHLGSNTSELNSLLEKVAEAVLILACDCDNTIKNMYDPLAKQMVHWYSSPKQLGSKHTHIILETLFDKISNPNNAKLRDLSAQCLKEFVAWTIKQSNKQKSLQRNAHNIDEIIDKLKYFSTHPDPTKRLSAALIFNNVYTVLREEDYLLNRYWLDLLYTFVTNLSLEHSNGNEECLMQVNAALDHLLRVFIEREYLFNSSAKEEVRATPPKFEGNMLKDAAKFLLENTTSLSCNCRVKCMEMFYKLAPLVHGSDEKRIVEEKRGLFFDAYTHDSNKRLEDCEAFKWFYSLLCLLDAHVFVMRRGLLPEYSFASSKLAVIIQHEVISRWKALENPKTIIKGLITSDLKEEYSIIRSLLRERIYDLTIVQMENNHYFAPEFFNNALWDFLYHSIFEYYTNDEKLTAENQRLILLLSKRPESKQFSLQIHKNISDKLQGPNNFTVNITQGDRQILRSILKFRSNLNLNVTFDFIPQFFHDLLEEREGILYVKKMYATNYDYFNLKLQLALETQLGEFIVMLCDKRFAKCLETHETKMYGQQIFSLFEKTAVEALTRVANFEVFLKTSLEALDVKYVYYYVCNILKYVNDHLSDFANDIRSNLIQVIAKFWFKFRTIFVDNTYQVILGIDLIEKMAFIKGNIDEDVILKWVLDLFNFQLDKKEENYEFIKRMIYGLGLTARKGMDERVGRVLQSTKENLQALENDSNIVCTTLMINSYIEAAQHSKSIDVLKHGLHLLVTMENDLDSDLDISKIFVEHTTIELQLETLQEIYALCSEDYTYKQKMQIAENLSQFLRSCNYEAFEAFYVRNVKEIEAKFKAELDSKITACILTMTLFARIDSDKFALKSCPVTRVMYEVKDGRELIRGFFKILLDAQKEEENSECFRLYQCCAYNALISVICCSRKDNISFYSKLFKEAIFDKLIDTQKAYNFDVELDEVPKRKKVLVGIRSEVHARQGEPDRKTRYIESQHVFKSTLSEDILRYDFNNMTVRTQSDLVEEASHTTDLQVELSGEEIDQHECMPHICGLIKHLDEMNLIAESEKPEVWINCIRNLLLGEQHLNVKLFWAKVIANNQELLKGQAKWLIGPIIKVITDNQQINCINSFVIDMVVMLLTTWSEIDVDERDKEQPSKLLDFLMQHVYSESTEVFKYNIVMLGLAVERWKNIYEAPYALILEKLSTVTSDKAKCIIPVHLINILLVNDIVPWESKMKQFMKNLTNTLDSDLKKIYSAGAETIGLALKFTSEHEVYNANLERFAKLVTDKLQGIKSDVKQVYCLEAMAKNFPAICNEFLNKIINYITDENTEFKCITLRILLKCFEKVCEMEGLAKMELEALLKDSSTEVQNLTLELINKSVDELNISSLKPIVKIVATFLSNKNPISRSTMYDILMAVYTKFCLSEDELCLDVVSLCRDVLLQGVMEDEPEIEEKLIKFWVSNDNLPKKIDAKILYVLKDMYKTTTEDLYLNYTSYILLSNLGTDLSEAMFEHPLEECTFSDYELSTNWKDRHLSMMPLFASSLSSQDNLLRATQTLQFDATQRNTIASQRATFLETGSSFSFRREHAIKNPNDLVISNKYKIIARRFNKDKSQVSKFHAGREIKKKTKQLELRKEAIKKRDNDIRIYRKYRLGDLPDIEIQFSAVVLPLQELAKDDPHIARLLYTSFFDSALESTRLQDFIAKSSDAINFIFINSSNYTPALIAMLLDIALKYKESIKFEPNVISKACLGSGLMSMGCLLIEEYINALPAEEPPAKRSKGVVIDNKTLHWVKLAELYKAMEDWDVVHSIFLYKMNCSESTVEAIKNESSGLWKNASGLYRNLIQEEEDNDRKDFYFESFFKCVSELSKWKDLTDCIDQFVAPGDTWSKLWGDNWNKEKLLPHYLKAQIRRALDDVPLKNALSERLNLDLQDKERSAYLKDNHSEDLAFLGIVEKDFSISRSFLQIFVSNFLVNWSYTNPLFTLLRVQKLLNMRNVMDISLFMNDYDGLTKQNHKDCLDLICATWEKSTEEGFVSISQSESRNVYRKEFAQLIKGKLSDLHLEISELAAANSRLNSTMFKLDMKLVDTAVNSNHYYVAQKYIQGNQKKDGLESLEYNLFYSKVVCLNALLHDDTSKIVNKLAAALKLTDKCLKNDLLKTNQSLYLQTNELYFKITQELARMSVNDDRVDGLLDNSSLSSVKHLEKSGIEFFSNSLFHSERSGNPSKLLGDYFSKLAYYMLGKGEEGEKELMLFTLRGMKYESNEAILLFSYLLNMERLAELKEEFINETSKLPVWLFLKWIPQLLSYVGTDKVEAIHDIIVNIAKEYPNAIIYDYKIAKENFKLENVGNADVCRKLCEKLDILLENPLVDKMLESLNSVCTPGVIVSTAARKLCKALRVSEEKFQSEGKSILEDLFETKYNYYKEDSVRGKLFQNVENLKKDFTSIIKSKFNPKTLEPKLKALMENNDDKSKRPSDIGQYSPWLKNFHGVDYDREIEIPGQYDGSKRPLLQYHVKLAGFASDVKVMVSLRYPIKITMIGSNTKEYEFLVKYAEDLRQDQRIEQIFKLMNSILNNNSDCCKRKLNIFTYEVIPLTKNLGIIEWVGETKKLRDFIEDGIPKAKDKIQFQKIGNEYVEWMKKLTRKKNASPIEAYINSMMKIGRTDVCANYQALVNKVPQNALKQSLWNISVDTENMFALREVFIKSYAVMCISNWLLGIGDRHLSNILVSLKDGRALGIDFGHAFGTATELQIPELIPFRLTPQILNVMQPHNEHGALQESMVHALRALLESKDVLLATMEVFIREPTLNWFESADVEYPKKKIKLARKKFQAVNPRVITMEEVKGRLNEDVRLTEKFLDFVKGYGDNYRAGVAEENLTAEEQVRCLLDQATDQNLLGRMYAGWEPWV